MIFEYLNLWIPATAHRMAVRDRKMSNCAFPVNDKDVKENNISEHGHVWYDDITTEILQTTTSLAGYFKIVSF